MERRSIALLALLLVGGDPALAISKCRDTQGRLVYVQTRSCPAHLEPLPYAPPFLNEIETGARPAGRPARKAVRRSAPRRPDPKEARCENLKQRFRSTNEPCRGVSGCRHRNDLRQRLRALYKEDFCFTRSGAIDSFHGP